MPYLSASYDLRVVGASFLLACFASFVALDLAKRVRTDDRSAALGWWIGGSISMGTGIWSMHFVGMLAYSLPIQLGYTGLLTFISWLAAVAVSAVALRIASQTLDVRRLALGALSMGLGICTMHYLGMAALDMTPAIVWDAMLVAASALIATVASAVALLIFSGLRQLNHGAVVYQAAAAVVMGAAICGMHYTGMAAMSVPVGSVCLSAGALGGQGLVMLVTLASVTMLGVTWFTSLYDARMRGQANRLAQSLQVANRQLQSVNEELQRRAFVDPLTGLPNRLLFEDRLSHAVRRATRHDERNGDRLAVLFIDLDGFKPVNDRRASR